MRVSPIAAAVIPAVLPACAAGRAPTKDLSLAERVQAPGLLFDVVYSPADAQEVARIRSGLLSAGPRLFRWGAFRQGVLIRVYPDHASLEEAIDRRGYPWLHAWSFGDQILLQSPRSWSAAERPAVDSELQELLVHELTHALMYQLIAPDDAPDWTADAPIEEPPIWFREGMASVTAGQGHRRMSSEELAAWLAAHPGVDLLHPSAELYRTEQEPVYGAAHHAFDLLLEQCGEQAVRDVLRGVRSGARFADAFKAATGKGLADFEQTAIRTRFAASGAQSPGAGGP